MISTHTSRVGCDLNSWCLVQHHIISTHTSRVGCDKILEDAGVEVTFLLTHPVWDVTEYRVYPFPGIKFLLTHPVWDVTQNQTRLPRRTSIFLLTHPVWDVTIGGDLINGLISFLLTHPVWDVTVSAVALVG